METLKSRADPHLLREQRVAFVRSDFELDTVELEIEDYFTKLRRFVETTVKKGRGLLMFLE